MKGNNHKSQRSIIGYIGNLLRVELCSKNTPMIDDVIIQLLLIDMMQSSINRYLKCIHSKCHVICETHNNLNTPKNKIRLFKAFKPSESVQFITKVESFASK